MLERWRRAATDEAQLLLHLNEEVARHVCLWDEEKRKWQGYEDMVRNCMRCSAREGAMVRMESHSGSDLASPLPLGREETELARAELRDLEMQRQSAQASIAAQKIEIAMMEAEILRWQPGVDFYQSHVRALHTVL